MEEICFCFDGFDITIIEEFFLIKITADINCLHIFTRHEVREILIHNKRGL